MHACLHASIHYIHIHMYTHIHSSMPTYYIHTHTYLPHIYNAVSFKKMEFHYHNEYPFKSIIL